MAADGVADVADDLADDAFDGVADDAPAAEADASTEYLAGWAALGRLLGQGASWSGHERNNCFVNLGAGRFADASFVSGLDFADDGRALAVLDQDGDGHLDLWLKNRTGPQLRFMRNTGDTTGVGDANHWVSLLLQGTASNRDAVGAEVRLRAGGRVRRRFVAAGDGYLSQSSRRLHFGLGAAAAVEDVVVHWPGGPAESFAGVAVDRRYRLVQGTGQALTVASRRVAYPAAPAPPPAPPAPPAARRVLLKTPLPLPPTLTSLMHASAASAPPSAGEPRSLLLNLWAGWCEPCRGELAELAEAYPRLLAAGIDVLPLSVDAPADREAAEATFRVHAADRMPGEGPAFRFRVADDATREALQAVLRHVLIRHDELTLPTSLLIDARGALQMVYLGVADPGVVAADAARFLQGDLQAARRGLDGGRWYFRSPRDLVGLAADLSRRGLQDDARYFLALDRLQRSTR